MSLFRNGRELQFETCKLQQSPRMSVKHRRGMLFNRGPCECGEAVESKKFRGINWELEGEWLLIGWGGTGPHWLGCCCGERGGSLPSSNWDNKVISTWKVSVFCWDYYGKSGGKAWELPLIPLEPGFLLLIFTHYSFTLVCALLQIM